MRFSLQDVKKSVQRRNGELAVSLHFLRHGELFAEIECLIAYHERLLNQPQRAFSLDDARACVGEYRLAHCLLATLSNWYTWRQREWSEVVQELNSIADLAELASAAQLRLALYNSVNEHYSGFLDAQTRPIALQEFAVRYGLNVEELEYLLALDSEEEARLVRDTAEPPTAQEVATLYNQWTFEAALFNASNVRFVIDCNAFANISSTDNASSSPPVMGVGAVIKRLCYLARKLGVYYDLAYEPVLEGMPLLLSLTLYGPQEVTGAPQQYGIRLARLCRLLMGYGSSRNSAISKSEVTTRSRKLQKPSLSPALLEATATIHFLQRAYTFFMDGNLLPLLSFEETAQRGTERADISTLFDSSIEQFFAEAFTALANNQGVDGWRLEREPEPLLLDSGIFIPDFALTRAQHRIYVEILGFWTASYRERKMQKLQHLQERNDLLLAIPIEAKDAFASIVPYFPIVFYDGQLSVTDVLQVLRSRYDDFAERLTQIDVSAVRKRVYQQGVLPERDCYEVLHCYRRSELQRAAERLVDDEVRFMPGIGLYTTTWMERLQSAFLAWMREQQTMPLTNVLQEIRTQWPILALSEDVTVEAILSMWPEIQIQRNSIFDAAVALADNTQKPCEMHRDTNNDAYLPQKETKKLVRERRAPSKRHAANEMTQENLWG